MKDDAPMSHDAAAANGASDAPTPFDSYRGPPPELSGRRAALVVVDLQYGSTHPDYGWVRFHTERGEGARMARYLERLEQLVFPNTSRLLEAFRRSGRPVVYLTVVAETSDYSDLRPAYRRRADRWREQGLPIPYSVAGSREAQVRDEVAPLSGEPVLRKVTASGFNSSNLRALLANWGVDFLVFVGVATNYCVESTLRDAADLGFDCLLVEDACATTDEEIHRLGVESMRPFAQIVTTAEAVAALDAAEAVSVPA
jgi:biuret amidohydrolase